MDSLEPVVIRGERVRLVPPADVGFAQVTGAWVNDVFTHLIGGPAYQMSLAAREDFIHTRRPPSWSCRR